MDSLAKAVRSGYLLKQGELNKAWKLRWFELEDDKLKYFKSPDKSKAINYIPLDQAVVRAATKNVGKDNCFELITKQRVYHLVAKSRTEMEDWIKTLSVFTILHAENELINQSEDVICKNMLKLANFEEAVFLHQLQETPNISHPNFTSQNNNNHQIPQFQHQNTQNQPRSHQSFGNGNNFNTNITGNNNRRRTEYVSKPSGALKQSKSDERIIN